MTKKLGNSTIGEFTVTGLPPCKKLAKAVGIPIENEVAIEWLRCAAAWLFVSEPEFGDRGFSVVAVAKALIAAGVKPPIDFEGNTFDGCVSLGQIIGTTQRIVKVYSDATADVAEIHQAVRFAEKHGHLVSYQCLFAEAQCSVPVYRPTRLGLGLTKLILEHVQAEDKNKRMTKEQTDCVIANLDEILVRAGNEATEGGYPLGYQHFVESAKNVTNVTPSKDFFERNEKAKRCVKSFGVRDRERHPDITRYDLD